MSQVHLRVYSFKPLALLAPRTLHRPGHRVDRVNTRLDLIDSESTRDDGKLLAHEQGRRATMTMPPDRIATSFAEAQAYGLALSSTPLSKGAPSIARGQVRLPLPPRVSPRVPSLYACD